MNRLVQYDEVKTIVLEFKDKDIPAKFVKANVIYQTNGIDMIGDSKYVFCRTEEGKEELIVDYMEDDLESITIDNITMSIPFSQWFPCS